MDQAQRGACSQPEVHAPGPGAAGISMTSDHSLDRFAEMQMLTYAPALVEIRRGKKVTHWMWWIFPQFTGLGQSSTSRQFAIQSLDEAQAYFNHPVLGPRYIECVTALQDLATNDSIAVFGTVDAMKLQSSLTLFEAASAHPLIAAALDRWFGGARDQKTVDLLKAKISRRVRPRETKG